MSSFLWFLLALNLLLGAINYRAYLYVNRGFGTAGPPARVGSPPEVSRIVLVAG